MSYVRETNVRDGTKRIVRGANDRRCADEMIVYQQKVMPST